MSRDNKNIIQKTKTDTVSRLLDVAEQLFIKYGFAATSLRRVTQQARVNLAAVNYHFGSKEALCETVVARRLAPLVTAWAAELDQLEATTKQPSVEQLVVAFIRPCLALSKDPSGSGVLFVLLIGRMLVENHRLLHDSVSQQYSVFVQRSTKFFQSALPTLGAEELTWRMHLAFGTMFNAFSGNDVLKIFIRSQVVTARDPDALVKHLLPFVVAGLAAPAKC